MKTRKSTTNILMALIILNVNTIVAQTDFRKTTWGMNASAVKSNESSKLLTEDHTKIIYDCVLSDIKAKIIYTFTTSGHLMRSKYYISPEYININYYIRDFKMFTDLLTQKYGESSKKSIVTTSGKQSLTENEWAAYLSSGALSVEITWNTVKTDIILTLSKVGERPAIQIDYISKEYNNIDIKEKKEVILKNL